MLRTSQSQKIFLLQNLLQRDTGSHDSPWYTDEREEEAIRGPCRMIRPAWPDASKVDAQAPSRAFPANCAAEPGPQGNAIASGAHDLSKGR